MKTKLRLAASLVLLAGIAGCEPLGDGNTAERLDLTLGVIGYEQGVFVPAADPTPAYVKMYDCFCSNLSAIVTFGDGTASNFIYRTAYTSSNPDVVRVMTVGQEYDERCPAGQRIPGLLIPEGLGEATITARFGSLVATTVVRVIDTQPLAAGNFTVVPRAPATSGGVAVGALLQLTTKGTLDARERALDNNVRSWTLTPEDEDIAKIDTNGNVTGFAIDGGAPRTVSASFGDNCPVIVTADVRVGDILGPLSIVREPGLVAVGDPLLATNTDELLDVTAGLDFDDDGVQDGTQVMNNQIALGAEEDCTLRVYDASVPTTNCAETAGTCTSTTPVCTEASDTACPTSLTTACRTEAATVISSGTNRIIAVGEGASPVRFTANYPRTIGDATTLVAGIDADQTTLQVTTLTGYPVVFPWYGVIDRNGSREDVRVTASSTATDGVATLTVVRGISSGGAGSAAGAHAAGATFEQRAYASTMPVEVQGDESTLTSVDVVDPVSSLPALGTLQLHAQGTFTDDASATREQRVTRLSSFASGSPALTWTTSAFGIAAVGSTSGLVTSRTACGGEVTIRARASTSTNTDDDAFDPDTTTDDVACDTGDPLCDQVELCIDGLSPLPDGTVCADGPHDCTP